MAHPGHHAEHQPDGVALIESETGATLTWIELHRRSTAAANHFHDLGLRPGDSLAFCLENRFDFAPLAANDCRRRCGERCRSSWVVAHSRR